MTYRHRGDVAMDVITRWLEAEKTVPQGHLTPLGTPLSYYQRRRLKQQIKYALEKWDRQRAREQERASKERASSPEKGRKR